MHKNTCCFFGHRKIEITNTLVKNLYNTLEALILENQVNTFLFGSKSQFDTLCYQVVSNLKEKYCYIKRVYVRAEFPYINDDYASYLLKYYEESYFPNNILKAGRASYVERNYEMINKSNFCVIYFNDNYTLAKSGTKLAYNYAYKNNKTIINMFNN